MNTIEADFALLLLTGVAVGLLAWGLTRVVRLVNNAFELEPMIHVTTDDMRRVDNELTAT